MQQAMFGFSTTDIRKLAYNITCQNNVPHRFKRDKRIAGKDWLAGFLKFLLEA